MTYLAHTGHAQLGALSLSCVGWTLTAMALGLIQWRVWLVSDMEVISSGVAWVGVWRACFNSHTLVTPAFRVMHCRYIGLTEAFTPPEIVAGQVLMLLSLLVGLCGNAGAVYALRNVYSGMDKNFPIHLTFFTTGALCLMAATMSLIPLLWNLSSVVTNQTIRFPPEFKMPQAPDSQHVGCGIGIGMVGAVLMTVSGVIFCMYRLPVRSQHLDGSSPALPDGRGKDNPAFESHEHRLVHVKEAHL
ncbi:LOW QUALITY PROTEIN: claudin-34 [Cottoperca gobio]|uniref:LOW QUALITY PROTEIN: claudin-34 n=1 Tax=Cottoperca gobio TaxID=56716 RepID=A0A6J2QT85_COTGO|nr:LOW QUALITY PROTEIN: claudin-34 [Cottoperca gobio]